MNDKTTRRGFFEWLGAIAAVPVLDQIELATPEQAKQEKMARFATGRPYVLSIASTETMYPVDLR